MLETEILKILRALEAGEGCTCNCNCEREERSVECFFNVQIHYNTCLFSQARNLRERIEAAIRRCFDCRDDAICGRAHLD